MHVQEVSAQGVTWSASSESTDQPDLWKNCTGCGMMGNESIGQDGIRKSWVYMAGHDVGEVTSSKYLQLHGLQSSKCIQGFPGSDANLGWHV